MNHTSDLTERATALQKLLASQQTLLLSTASVSGTRTIITTANRLLKELYKPNYKYHKCGVQLSQIQPALPFAQDDLFDLAVNPFLGKSGQLMQVFDQINRRFPKSIAMAASGLDQSWKAKAERTTKQYTTDWTGLVDAYSR
jgi:DNA polymerase V